MITLNIFVLVFAKYPKQVLPFEQLIRVLLGIEFSFIIVQPLYFFIIESYEFSHQKDFFFERDDTTMSPSLSFFCACLILIGLFTPSVLNFITMHKLIDAIVQQTQLGDGVESKSLRFSGAGAYGTLTDSDQYRIKEEFNNSQEIMTDSEDYSNYNGKKNTANIIN
eukprot:403341243